MDEFKPLMMAIRAEQLSFSSFAPLEVGRGTTSRLLLETFEGGSDKGAVDPNFARRRKFDGKATDASYRGNSPGVIRRRGAEQTNRVSRRVTVRQATPRKGKTRQFEVVSIRSKE